jgi:hypothetical protein
MDVTTMTSADLTAEFRRLDGVLTLCENPEGFDSDEDEERYQEVITEIKERAELGTLKQK